MSGAVKITFDGVNNLLAALKQVSGTQVMVGIPADEDPRKGEPIGNAYLGYIHENGSTAKNIPARPFLAKGVESVKDKCINALKLAATKAMDGNTSAIEQGYNQCGLAAQAGVKNTIVAGDNFAPLSPVTLSARARAGYSGTKPLIRTGSLLNSITYVLRKTDGTN